MIFFIDTEGAGGFETSNSPEETIYLISQFIAPYATLSNVIITISKPNITNGEIESLIKMFDIFQSIRSHLTRNSESTNFINIINDVYSPGDSNYSSKKKEVLIKFQKRSNELYQDITLFPKFDNSKACYEQNDFYNDGFKNFAGELINKLEEFKNEAFYDYQEALYVFTQLINITRDQNIIELTKKARQTAV